jgi:hypothetical protein
MPKLAMGKLLHLYNYAHAFISSERKVDRAATCLYFAIQSQSSLLAVTIQHNEEEQLHVPLRDSIGLIIPEYAPATPVLRPVTESANYVMHEPH